jgi:hypothetical protein
MSRARRCDDRCSGSIYGGLLLIPLSYDLRVVAMLFKSDTTGPITTGGLRIRVMPYELRAWAMVRIDYGSRSAVTMVPVAQSVEQRTFNP